MSEALRGFPLLLPALTATPAPDQPGHVRVLRDGAPTAALLGNAAWRVAEEFDGARTAVEIFHSLREEGIPVPSPDFITALAGALVQAGLVQLLTEPRPIPWRRYAPTDVEALEPLRHRCFGCGRSCHGHVIAPLDDDFLARIPALHDALAREDAALASFKPTERVQTPDGRVVDALTRTHGHCIYLGDDNLCRLHARFGADAKPIVCRLFPLTLVQTESAIRIGTPLRCYLHHRTFEDAPFEGVEAMTGLSPEVYPEALVRGHDPAHRERLELNAEPGSAAAAAIAAEEALLQLLHHPDAELASLLLAAAELAGGARPEGEPAALIQRADFGAGLVERLRRVAAGAPAIDENHFHDARDPGHYAEVHRLCAALAALQPRPVPPLVGATRRFVLHTLRQHLYLREWIKHPSLPVSVFIEGAGIIAAAWIAADAGEDGEAQVGDRFAFALTAWTRMMQNPRNVALFLEDHGDFRDLLQGLGVSLADA